MTIYQVAQNSKQPKIELRYNKEFGSIVVQNPKLFSRQKNKMEKSDVAKISFGRYRVYKKIIFTCILFLFFKIIHQLRSINSYSRVHVPD